MSVASSSSHAASFAFPDLAAQVSQTLAQYQGHLIHPLNMPFLGSSQSRTSSRFCRAITISIACVRDEVCTHYAK